MLLTRAADRVAGLERGCRALGLEPVCLPCIAIEALAPTAPAAPDRGTVVFTSVPAVRAAARWRPLPWPGTRALAIGAATADALATAGQPPWAAPVEPYTSEALLAWLAGPDGPGFAGLPGLDDGVTVVKGAGGRDVLASALAAAGVSVATLDVYRRVRPAHPDAAIDAALSPPPDVVVATSDEVLDNLLALAGPRAAALRARPLVVNGERAAAHARSRGFVADVLVARPAGDAGQLERLAAWARVQGRAGA